ncbi:hypothetical protein ACH50_08825 [Franconibacter pulveris]|uniref:Uncharacterized protein n=1 Tax=Franconibacter pulveris TaxID=435910 RepID=A0A0J8YCS9_9ENTR|nr:hypothetical protein ACH50_08825 [Franconibacter pulveris]
MHCQTPRCPRAKTVDALCLLTPKIAPLPGGKRGSVCFLLNDRFIEASVFLPLLRREERIGSLLYVLLRPKEPVFFSSFQGEGRGEDFLPRRPLARKMLTGVKEPPPLLLAYQ